MYSEIFQLIKTTDDVEKITENLDKIEECYFNNDPNALEHLLTAQIGMPFGGMMRKILNDNRPDQFLSGLREELKKIKKIDLTLAFEPSEAFIDNLYFFFKRNLEGNIALHIVSDPAICGGVMVSIDGQYRDYSLARFLKYEFDRQKPLLRSYLQNNCDVVAEPQ